MQENEKYGIELEAKTSLFKKGIQEAIKYTKAFGQGVKESFGEQINRTIKNISDSFREDFNLFDKDYSKRIDYIKEEMDAVADQINAIKEGGKEGNLKELEAEYDRLTKKLEFFTSKQSELKEELEETNDTAGKSKSILSSLFDNSIGKIKRFTYYLLGARSVFSLFMKYRSAYYQFNEQMQYQSELSQNAIALSLAPAFEFLGNIIAYASIGLAKFIELLTGVNVLSKVTTKGIRDYNKSLKETQTLVSGIDEITNLTNPQTLGLADQYSALNTFRDKIKEVEEFFSKNEWIGKIADGLKIVWKYLEENIWPVLEQKVFPTVEKIFDFVGKIFKTIGLIFDKLGLVDYVLKPIWAVIKSIYYLADFLLDVIIDIFTGQWGKISQDFDKFKQNVKDAFTFNEDDEIVIKVKDKKEFDDAYKKLQDINKNGGKVNIEFENQETLEDWAEYINSTKKDAQELGQELDYSSVMELDGRVITTWRKKAQLDFNIITNSVDGLLEKVNEVTDKDYIIKIKLQVDEFVQNFGKSASDTALSLIDYVNQLTKNGYSNGLDYVPYDNYPALLHKGEAVVPAKYNPTIHSEGNDYTNSLLETLVMKVDDLAQRPNVFEIDGKQLARTTYPLLEAEKRNYSYNGGVSR